MIIERKKLSELKEAPYNPRKLSSTQEERLLNSIKRWGLVEPIIWNKQSGHVVGGHQRLKILLRSDETETDVVVVDLPPAEEKALNVALNKVTGEWDADKLAEVFKDLQETSFDISLTGFDYKDIKDVLGKDAANDIMLRDVPTEDYIVPVEAHVRKIQTGIKRGDLFKLGQHRLLCGDATNQDDVRTLQGNTVFRVAFTDPPYNIDYKDIAGNHNEIQNDALPEKDFKEFLKKALNAWRVPQGFVCCNWKSYPTFYETMTEIGLTPKACIVWDKERGVQNLDRYFKQHEFIIYFGPFGGQKTLRGDVWKYAREPADHPTPKPVELIASALNDTTNEGDAVIDTFAGSGSTLIAAEQTKRRAFAMEIDPQYCQVIIDRWEKFTSRKAEKTID